MLRPITPVPIQPIRVFSGEISEVGAVMTKNRVAGERKGDVQRIASVAGE
jgi:hypothetical protein